MNTDEKPVLAFDTSTAACSVGVSHGDAVLIDHQVVERRHNAVLLPMIDGLLQGRRDLAAIGFGSGPGSFTGVRIAASVAQGIALGLALPVVSVSSLATVAAGALRIEPGAGSVIVCIAARRGEMYTCVFERGGDHTVPMAVTAERAVRIDSYLPPELPGTVAVCGDAARYLAELDAWRNHAVIDWPHPHAEDLLRIVRARLADGAGVDVAQALPVYLEGSGAWQKIAGR